MHHTLGLIRSVTLDLDGTLLDTIPDLAAAANAMMRELGRAEYPVETVASFVGKGIPNLVARCLPDLDDAALKQAQAVFRRHYAVENGRRSKPYPGVFEGLQLLRAAGIPLAVITNKASDFTGPLLASSGLAPLLEFAISGDSLAEKKPSPLPVRHACARLGVPPAQNLHIGDSGNDYHAARDAGCPVLLVPYGYNEGQDVRELDRNAIVGSLAEAAHLVLGHAHYSQHPAHPRAAH